MENMNFFDMALPQGLGRARGQRCAGLFEKFRILSILSKQKQ